MPKATTHVSRVRAGNEFQADGHAPLLVIGAGACGLTAALRAKSLGCEVVVLERDAMPSGSTALSSGFIPACETSMQRQAGVTDDSVERLVVDIESKSKGRADPVLTRAYAEAIGPALMWLQDTHALPFELLTEFTYPGHSRLRMHAVPERTGRGLIDRLARACERESIPVLCNAHVKELVADGDDRIVGAYIDRPDGTREALSCDTVLLACNGYGGNAQLVAEHLPSMANAVFAGHQGNDGSALAWGKALSAAHADLSGYQGHGSWADPHGVLITWALMTEGGIQINREGRRFHDETEGYSEAAVKVLSQDGGFAYDIFDDALLKLARSFPDFNAAETAGAVRCAHDGESLAALLNVPARQLASELSMIESSAQTGTADAFGRVFKRSLTPPYYAIRVTGALFHTQGGLQIDARCHVLRANKERLPNLLAAGGAARGVSGDQVWGYLSGNGLLSAVAGGWLAAQTAANLSDA